MLVEVSKAGWGSITNKLAVVKLIKDYTGKGLKEVKDWVDEFDSVSTLSKTIDVSNPVNFEHELSQIGGNGYLVSRDVKSRIRQRKIVKIGLGDLNDKIELLSEDLTNDLVRNYGSSFNSINEFFNDFLSKLDEKTIDKLISDEEISN